MGGGSSLPTLSNNARPPPLNLSLLNHSLGHPRPHGGLSFACPDDRPRPDRNAAARPGRARVGVGRGGGGWERRVAARAPALAIHARVRERGGLTARDLVPLDVRVDDDRGK